jgi:hypothetical protein
MTSSTSAGTTIGISAAAPASFDKTGYAALTYTTIGGVGSIPAFGASTAWNTFQPLNGAEEQHKGPVSYGQLQVPMAYDKADAGQTLTRTASRPGNNALYSFIVTFPNGDKFYFQARVSGAPLEVGSATNVIMMNPTLGISTVVVEDIAA